ncbi:hypothetical protein AB7Y15_19475 [Morganella morganii]|uniref:hypothetical protein n=1 Tax=Morganella morganii TaxID=582 RepID=UPI0034E446A4
MTREKKAYIKTAQQKQDVCLRIVRNLRQLDSFTVKAVSLAAELKIMMATTFVKMMEDIGSVRVSHKIGKQVYYVFDDYAVSKIKAHFSSFPDKKRKKVKASVSDREVCCGMPTMQ